MDDPPSRTKADIGWLVAVSVMVVVTGMAYSLWWAALVRHDAWYWIVPSDTWGTVRASHWIDWGGFSFIYNAGTALVTLPGFHLLLAPVVALSSHLHLSETAPGLPGPPKPTSWLLIGPVFLACATLPVFAADALARRIGSAVRTRRALGLGAGAAVWPTIAIWGHPEDVLALGLATYALVALLNRRLGAAGWLLGGALAMQLYVIALVPLFIAVVGRRKAAPLVARAAVLPGFLLVAVIVPNARATVHALLDQPNFPKIDHATPWVSLAPRLGHGAVAAGPGRIIGLVLAVAIGALGIRRPVGYRPHCVAGDGSARAPLPLRVRDGSVLRHAGDRAGARGGGPPRCVAPRRGDGGGGRADGVDLLPARHVGLLVRDDGSHCGDPRCHVATDKDRAFWT